MNSYCIRIDEKMVYGDSQAYHRVAIVVTWRDDSALAAYIARGTVVNLTLEVCWAKEESPIKQILCSTLPDTSFNRIKSAASVEAD